MKQSIFSDNHALSEAAATQFLTYLKERAGQVFSLALSGGTSPLALYRLLAEAPLKDRIDWSLIHIFLADERCVEIDSIDSNYRALKETLLDHVPIPKANIHMPKPCGEPEAWALHYNQALVDFFGSQKPRFDLILLGMGPDGHTASLFPNQTHQGDAWIVPVRNSPKPPPNRISFSIDLINAAHHILFMVSGLEKAQVLADIMQGRDLPAGRVKPGSGDLIWLIEKQAASKLSSL